MAKKRKVSGGAPVAEPTEGWNEQGGKLAFKSYEDLADAQDDFHINRDKVMLDDGPDAKRRRKWEQEGELLDTPSIAVRQLLMPCRCGPSTIRRRDLGILLCQRQ